MRFVTQNAARKTHYLLFPCIFIIMVLLVMSVAPLTAYAAAPTVSSAVNYRGNPWGAEGAVVTINGSGFTGATEVKFGSVATTEFTVDSDTKITATAPAGSGTVHVTVTTAEGSSAESDADLFTYLGSEELVSLWNTGGGMWSPPFHYDTTAYTTASRITGSINFGYFLADSNATVTFNGNPGTLGDPLYGLARGFCSLSGLQHGATTVNVVVSAPGGTPNKTYFVTVYYPPNWFTPNGGNIDTSTLITIDTTGMPGSPHQCWYTVTPGETGTDPSTTADRYLYDGAGFNISTPGTYTVVAAVSDGTSWSSPLEATFIVAEDSEEEPGEEPGEGEEEPGEEPGEGDEAPTPKKKLPKTAGALPLFGLAGAAALAAGYAILRRKRR